MSSAARIGKPCKPQELSHDAADPGSLFEVDFVLDPTRQLAVTPEVGQDATLIGVEDDERFLLVTRGALTPREQRVVVHRDDHVLVGAGLRSSFEATFGRSPEEAVAFIVDDNRAAAAREAGLAGWVAVLGWCVGLTSLGAAVLVARRRRVAAIT